MLKRMQPRAKIDDPVPVPAVVRDLTGPYDTAVNGRCALGHAVNGSGRCSPLNLGTEISVNPAVTAPSPL